MATNILRRIPTILAAVLTTALPGAWALSGCSSSSGDCASLCAEAVACPGGTHGLTQSQIQTECNSLCDKEENLSQKAGCSSELDAYLGCVGDVPNICDEQETCSESSQHPELVCTGPCGKEDTALEDCTAKFCADPKNKQVCTL